MKVLVTGGSGFLGSHVADSLTALGHKVLIYDIKRSKWIKKNQKMIIGNILDIKKLSKYIRNSDIIYNFAGLADMDIARFRSIDTVKLNILSLVKILEIAKKFKVKRFIQASSVYSNSEEGGFYGKSKRAAEDYIFEFNKTFNLPFTILRYGSLYGSRADNNNGIKKLIFSAKKRKKIIYRGNKEAVRRYIHVEDAAKLTASILSNKYKNKVFTITGKREIKVKDLIKFLSKKFKISSRRNIYLNEKNTAHYKFKPTPIIKKKGKNIFVRKERNFLKSIVKII